MSWVDLLATATVGTDRRAGTRPEEVLAGAAAATAYRAAGLIPTGDLAAPASAPADPALVVGAAATNRLARLLEPAPSGGLDGRAQAELLEEWLRLAAARGRRVPPEHLPALLAAGRRRAELRSLVAAAGGVRAGWLAGQHPEWDYLASIAGPGSGDERAVGDPTAWSEGTLGQRTGYLAAARRRDPVAARELLWAEWASLPPDERRQLIGVLAAGLSLADEEFLEAALDDRRREVRAAAAELLGRLPGSRYNARMVERARACLRLDRRTARVDPPTECDRSMRRDGVTVRPPAGTGERAWRLEEILARTPLATWDRALARARVADGWADPVRRGLARAAATQRDADWASTLLAQLAPAAVAGGRPEDRLLVESLYPALPADELMARAERGLRKDPAGTIGLDRLLELCPSPWPDRFGYAIVSGLVALATGRRRAYRLDDLCRIAALRLPPSLAPEVAELATAAGARAAPDDRHRLRPLGRLADTLQFRYELTEELT